MHGPSVADVFAFGVLLAELLAGEPAWAALKSHAQVIAGVLSGKRPVVPASVPSELKVCPGHMPDMMPKLLHWSTA